MYCYEIINLEAFYFRKRDKSVNFHQNHMTCAMINDNHEFYKYDGEWQENLSQ